MKVPPKFQWQALFFVLKPWEKILFVISFFVFVLSIFSIITLSYIKKTKIVPAEGGVIVEGVVGKLVILNPLFTLSQTDKDLVALLFSPLFEIKDEKPIPVLAKNLEILDNGRTFKIQLRENLFWDDGEKITADDVIFTIALIQNSETKSPLKTKWLGVEAEKISDEFLILRTKGASFSFLENLTLRPIPKHFFQKIPAEKLFFISHQAIAPASGPFKISKINYRNTEQISSIELTRNEKYYGEKPKIKKMVFLFFENEEALLKGAREGLVDSFLAKGFYELKGFQRVGVSLPRYFALFFNLQNKILNERGIREAINLAINKKAILQDIFMGNGELVQYPSLLSSNNSVQEFNPQRSQEILEGLGFSLKDGRREKEIAPQTFRFKKALKMGDRGQDVKELQKCLSKFPEIYPTEEVTGFFGIETKRAVIMFQEKFKDELLTPLGLQKGTGEVAEKTIEKLNQVCFTQEGEKLILEFDLTIGKDILLEKMAQKIKEDLEKIGIIIHIKQIDLDEIETETIPKRDYQILLFGEMYAKIKDPYSFWHSSQIEGGINLSNLKDENLDKLLIEIKTEFNEEKRRNLLQSFDEFILKNIPAVFLVNPTVFYFVKENVGGVTINNINSVEERFQEIHKWYKKEKRIWR